MKIYLKTCLLLLVAVVFGLSSTNTQAFELITTTKTVMYRGVEIEIVRTADNFIVLYDSSGSMGVPYKDSGKTKIEVEKAVLELRNANLPDLGFNAGLYSFSPKAWTLTTKALIPYYDMQPYNKDAFAAAIEKLPDKASGPTLLQGGIYELGKILSKLQGKTVVFIFTDGKFTEKKEFPKPVSHARRLAQKHNVCFYVISSATGQMERQILENVASINACSRVIDFDDLVEKPEYITGGLFVINKRVVKKSINIENVIGAKTSDILFDFDQTTIKPEYDYGLNLLGRYLSDNPMTYAVFAGFTDNVGSQTYNLDLSRRRAEAVSSYLSNRFNIDPDRFILHWYGKAAPVGDNGTEAGRRMNRRVELIVIQ